MLGRVSSIRGLTSSQGSAAVAAAVLSALVSVMGSGAAQALDETAQVAQKSAVNMPVGVTHVGASIYGLHMLILSICVVIGIAVFGVMFYSIYHHRKSRGAVPAQFHESTKVEVAWTVVPFLILIGMAVPATSTLLDIYDVEDADMDIMITGYQWKWKYEYLQEDGENVSFFSNLATTQAEIYNSVHKNEHYLLEVDEPLVIPVDTKVRLLVTANDVIHSFWVPELAVKRDAIPGFVNESWTLAREEGLYRGQCAELCGKDHGFMPIVVKVVSREAYADWLADKQEDAAQIRELMAQTFSMDELMTRGKDVYRKNCLACHGAAGEGGVGTAIAGSAMQAFGGILNDVDLAAVITYQRNAFGNNMGDMVQPIDIFNYKKG